MVGSLAGVRHRGYAILQDADITDIGASLGRMGQPAALTPKRQDEADSWSHSGIYGLGVFPWHTDGAVSSNPPRWIVLRALETSSTTSTELLQIDSTLLAKLRRTVLRTTERLGRVKYLPAVVPYGDGWRLRWDPRICEPVRGLAVQEVASCEPTARVTWRPGRVLVIDNYRLLHRRPAVSGEERRVLERTYVWSR